MPAIQENVSLLPYNTFKIQAKARYFTSVNSVDEFRALMETPVYQNHQRLILGGGSNILFTKDFGGLVIKVNLKGIEVVNETEEQVTVKVGAGENWHAFVLHCVSNNWGGVENLSLIPGTVGAAPIQNIGAYGAEVKEVITRVEGIHVDTGQVQSFSNQQCAFGYRESIFKHTLKEKFFISSVTLSLTKKNHRFNISYSPLQSLLKDENIKTITLKKISDAVIAIRKQKLPDPTIIGNAGSFFKNPTIPQSQYDELKKSFPSIPGYTTDYQEVKVPAAWLIEQCGWKGKTFDSIGVHTQQALVLVNYKNGEGEKIWKLAQKILASVQEKFNVQLKPEVNVI